MENERKREKCKELANSLIYGYGKDTPPDFHLIGVVCESFVLRESGHVAVKKLHRGYTSQACIEMTKLLGAMSPSDRAGSK